MNRLKVLIEPDSKKFEAYLEPSVQILVQATNQVIENKVLPYHLLERLLRKLPSAFVEKLNLWANHLILRLAKLSDQGIYVITESEKNLIEAAHNENPDATALDIADLTTLE